MSQYITEAQQVVVIVEISVKYVNSPVVASNYYYPWLSHLDIRRDMPDEEIIRKYLCLIKASITNQQMEKPFKFLLKQKWVISLHQ